MSIAAANIGTKMSFAKVEDMANTELKLWRKATVRPVAPQQDRHSIHAYFNTCPESPDGRYVLYYTSGDADGQRGDLRILERATGRETIIASDIETEDAHRAACQQWTANGRKVVFHNLRAGQWEVVAVEIGTLQQQVLAVGCLVGWGQPHADQVPLYGLHWDAKASRDLEMVNVYTGARRTVLTAAAVLAEYRARIEAEFGAETSLFFPIISPDSQRILFKLATPAGGDFRSAQASIRRWTSCYDLKNQKLLFLRKQWGHPSWHPDSRRIVMAHNEILDSDDGSTQPIPDLPKFPGTHPSVSSNRRIFTTDTQMEPFTQQTGYYGIAVAKMSGHDYLLLTAFDNSQGATSWRRSHPHPVFSADGKRIYFNENCTPWTQLYMAECALAFDSDQGQ